MCGPCFVVLLMLAVPGDFVRVKDSKWANAIECTIKGRLNTFVVDNTEDEKVLDGMIKRIFTRGQKPSIIRTPFPTRVRLPSLVLLGHKILFITDALFCVQIDSEYC